MRFSLFLGLTLLMMAEVCLSQEIKNDSLTTKNTIPIDTTFIKKGGKVVDIESYSKRFDPRKAILYSAVLPGAGQFYNKKYWKMPLVYGGFGFLIYVAHYYHTKNLEFRKELFGLINDTTGATVGPSGYNEAQLRTLVDQSRRERDFFIIMNGLFYMLQMVDAHVDAHLKEFDINPKMQVSIEPMINNSAMTGRNSGISLIIRF